MRWHFSGVVVCDLNVRCGLQFACSRVHVICQPRVWRVLQSTKLTQKAANLIIWRLPVHFQAAALPVPCFADIIAINALKMSHTEDIRAVIGNQTWFVRHGLKLTAIKVYYLAHWATMSFWWQMIIGTYDQAAVSHCQSLISRRIPDARCLVRSRWISNRTTLPIKVTFSSSGDGRMNHITVDWVRLVLAYMHAAFMSIVSDQPCTPTRP